MVFQKRFISADHLFLQSNSLCVKFSLSWHCSPFKVSSFISHILRLPFAMVSEVADECMHAVAALTLMRLQRQSAFPPAVKCKCFTFPKIDDAATSRWFHKTFIAEGC